MATPLSGVDAAALGSRNLVIVLVSGAAGLIGARLSERLSGAGHTVVRLARSTGERGESVVRWNPDTGALDARDLEGVHAVIHLAGEPIDRGRWTAAKKALILDSRVEGTRLLSNAIAGLARPPGILIAASAAGFYGDRGDEVLTEESSPGEGFLAEVCRRWEAATEPAVQRGTRVVNLRTGLVLSAGAGLLGKLLPLFKRGLGGTLGDGHRYMSWITLDDTVNAIHFTLETQTLSGPVNVASPNPVTNGEFTRTLNRVLGRPAFLRVPELAMRLALGGEKAKALAFTGARLLPSKLLSTGFSFEHPDLEPALRGLLRR